jgi:3-hydroxyacyl-CoA dehydrogenase
MVERIEQAAVLGAGTMGAAIAAHLANVGVRVLLLDIVPQGEDDRDKIARMGLERAIKGRPAAFYLKDFARLVEVGNFEDDMEKLAEVDWVIEAIVERLDIKRQLLEKVDQFRKPGSVVSTNTSGISVNAIAQGRSEDFRKHFLGTHFFNPPRYMKLLEIIPGKDTDPAVVDFIARYGEDVLGKGIVYAKDTPNFIANRIGVFGMMYTLRVMEELGLSIEEVDALTGKAMGRPKMATFRLADMVGIDILYHVAKNVYDNAPDDEWREIFKPPQWLEEMVQKGWLGDKTKQGFYKKVKGEGGKKERLVLDYKTLEYRPVKKVSFPSLEMAKQEEDLARRLKVLISGKDKGAQFAAKTLAAFFVYSANRIPEIADDVVNVDMAMQWGFNWEKGPFELWDLIGLEKSLDIIKGNGFQVPAKVQEMVDKGFASFYKEEVVESGVNRYFYDFETKDYKEIEPNPRVIILPDLKKAKKVVLENAEASLIDIGDGVACLEFHTKMNAIGPGILQMVHEALEEVRKNFVGLVIGNQGEHFSAGANIALLLMAIQNEEWEDIDWMVRSFQGATMALKYFEKPVVAAPHGITVGGGCEFCLHCHRIRAAAETYMGLVEVGVGLVPAGGGSKEMAIRNLSHIPADMPRGVVIDPFPYLRRAFETIGMARVATSAHEAREIGFLTPCDDISINKDYLIHDAKETVLALVRTGYKPPMPARIRVPGRDGYAYLEMLIYNMQVSGYISEHDAKIGRHVARILSGGDVPAGTWVEEQEFLDLEREAFLSLCGEPKTQERIQHMLTTGKPLRN